MGREAELEQLRDALNGTLAGRGGLLLLVGEPGIGKTRTAEELATYAQVRGAKVHWGRSHEGEGAPAYWPWAQAIRSYVREADPVALARELGQGPGTSRTSSRRSANASGTSPRRRRSTPTRPGSGSSTRSPPSSWAPRGRGRSW